MKKTHSGILPLLVLLASACSKPDIQIAEQWKETEISFTAKAEYKNPYTDVNLWVEFRGPGGQVIIRPGFWFEGSTWKVKFASPVDSGTWTWKSFSDAESDKGLNGIEGMMKAVPYTGNNELVKKGLLKMSKGKRNVEFSNGESFFMIADTPWGLPWRGTPETVTLYAKKRQDRGYNAALLMSLQPDRDAVGPRSRTELQGFDVAFEDLKDGHINQLNPAYFMRFDTLRNILLDHGIVPVFQPVFHGFGWKGLNVLGWDVDPAEYARYCRYLVARYGAGHAMYLVSGDSDGRDKGVEEGGMEIEKWDAYGQPSGFHYSPYCEVVPDWWNRPYPFIPHGNKIHQDKEWLDFQWCQTGHAGEHQPWKVEKMHRNLPVKAVANGEPTYEGIRDSANGSGWWQGHEAWLNFTSGGTMGVVYGAGGLWNWKLTKDETGWPAWANSPVSWREAIDLPGSVYPGYMSKALRGLQLSDIEIHPELAEGKLCLAKPGELYIVYLPDGGKLKLKAQANKLFYKWFDPIHGEFYSQIQFVPPDLLFDSGKNDPAVLIVYKQ